LKHTLNRPLGLEAVLRVRASKGIKVTAFHGNFFMRSSDLMGLPIVTPDNCFAVELSITENLSSSIGCFQSALLYTSAYGISCCFHP
jgi:protein transport protein SEC24